MAERMLQFVRVAQENPQSGMSPPARLFDFDEIYARFAPPQAAVRPAVAANAGVPFCQVHCPFQQHPGLAETHRRGQPGRSLRSSVGHQ